MEGTQQSHNMLSTTDEFYSSQAPTNRCSPLVSKLKKLLFRRVLIGVKDGRFFTGIFHCIDKQGNIILQDAVEYRTARRSVQDQMDQRCLGIILIPASCRVTCHVDCSVDEQMALLSLDE